MTTYGWTEVSASLSMSREAMEQWDLAMRDAAWRRRHGAVGLFFDWLTRGAFAGLVLNDPRPIRVVRPSASQQVKK